MIQTLGQLLVNSELPEHHRSNEPMSKSGLTKKLTALAREDPSAFVSIVSNIKRVGDEVSTLEGVSVGLEDIIPVYATRDAILKPAIIAIKTMKDPAQREKLILEVQDKIMKHTVEHPGTMTQMALSGARGNIPQLMKTIASPVAAVDARGHITPWLIGKSYSEGLSPADYWVTGNEARINTVKSTTAVAEPGDVAKIVVNSMYHLVITQDDCGTTNGIVMSLSDGHILGRYIAHDDHGFKRNDLLMRPQIEELKRKNVNEITVRSPMTCQANEGICKKCQGIDETYRPYDVGVNVGVRAAQALSEPLTQFVLNAKHGVRVLKGAAKQLDGLPGVRQMLEIPQSFFNKATLAEETGEITKIVAAPHGGNYVYVNKIEHYIGPHLQILVSVGQHVEAGDSLSEGVPKPDEIVKYKGLGAGRQYLVNALHSLYKNQGIDIDKRHLELLARADLDHVRILESNDHHPELTKGEIISYHDFQKSLQGSHKEMPVSKSEGAMLSKEVLHFTAGTTITPSIIKVLENKKITNIPISVNSPKIEFVMKPLTRNPLFNPDWLARLSHRYLKDTLIRGSHYGDGSNLHGIHPVPSYAYGAEFGLGPDGKY